MQPQHRGGVSGLSATHLKQMQLQQQMQIQAQLNSQAHGVSQQQNLQPPNSNLVNPVQQGMPHLSQCQLTGQHLINGHIPHRGNAFAVPIGVNSMNSFTYPVMPLQQIGNQCHPQIIVNNHSQNGSGPSSNGQEGHGNQSQAPIYWNALHPQSNNRNAVVTGSNQNSVTSVAMTGGKNIMQPIQSHLVLQQNQQSQQSCSHTSSSTSSTGNRSKTITLKNDGKNAHGQLSQLQESQQTSAANSSETNDARLVIEQQKIIDQLNKKIERQQQFDGGAACGNNAYSAPGPSLILQKQMEHQLQSQHMRLHSANNVPSDMQPPNSILMQGQCNNNQQQRLDGSSNVIGGSSNNSVAREKLDNSICSTGMINNIHPYGSNIMQLRQGAMINKNVNNQPQQFQQLQNNMSGVTQQQQFLQHIMNQNNNHQFKNTTSPPPSQLTSQIFDKSTHKIDIKIDENSKGKSGTDEDGKVVKKKRRASGKKSKEKISSNDKTRDDNKNGYPLVASHNHIAAPQDHQQSKTNEPIVGLGLGCWQSNNDLPDRRRVICQMIELFNRLKSNSNKNLQK